MVARGERKRVRREEYEAVESFPDFQIDHSASVAVCYLEGNGSCSLSYTGYLRGEYSSKDLKKIIDCYGRNLMNLPVTVSFLLENRRKKMREAHNLCFAAMEAMNRQREDTRLRFKNLSILANTLPPIGG